MRFWASLPALRRIFSRCWTRLHRTQSVFVPLKMHRSGLSKETYCEWVAHYGPVPHAAQDDLPIDRGSPPGRAVFERRILHVDDMQVQGETEFPEFWTRAKGGGVRTALAMPLMHENVPIGTITLRRMEVRPFL